MTSHQLAKLLLEQPDETVVLVVMGHTFHSVRHVRSHGGLDATARKTLSGENVVLVGHMLGKVGAPNL